MSNKLIPKINTQVERDMVVNRFFELLARIVFVENSSYKYRNIDQIVQIVNKTAKRMGLDIAIFADIDQIFFLRCNDEDIINLPSLLGEFKRAYRFQYRGERY